MAPGRLPGGKTAAEECGMAVVAADPVLVPAVIDRVTFRTLVQAKSDSGAGREEVAAHPITLALAGKIRIGSKAGASHRASLTL